MTLFSLKSAVLARAQVREEWHHARGVVEHHGVRPAVARAVPVWPHGARPLTRLLAKVDLVQELRARAAVLVDRPFDVEGADIGPVGVEAGSSNRRKRSKKKRCSR